MVNRVLISYCMRRFILGCNKSQNCPEQLEGYLIRKTKIEIYATIKHPLFRKEDLPKCWCKRLKFTPSPQNLGKIMRISLLYRGIHYRRWCHDLLPWSHEWNGFEIFSSLSRAILCDSTCFAGCLAIFRSMDVLVFGKKNLMWLKINEP